jgi:ribosome-binding protein aMBF1 (putative translation factor)
VDTIRTQRHQQLVEILVAARKKAGIRQADLARWLGKTQTFVARFEAGQRRIDIVELIALCRIIGIDSVKVHRKLLKVEDELWVGSNPRRRPHR